MGKRNIRIVSDRDKAVVERAVGHAREFAAVAFEDQGLVEVREI